MPHRIAIRMFQETSYFLYIPLSLLAMIDTAAITQIVSTILGVVVGFFAIRFYHAQTKKSEVEREVAELERDNLKMEQKAAKLKGSIKRKKSEDDE